MDEKEMELYEKLSRLQWLIQRSRLKDHVKNGPVGDPTRGQGRVCLLYTSSPVTEEQIEAVARLLRENEQAHKNFLNMPPSVKKTYTRAYLDAKTEAGRAKRLAWMAGRLEKNLKPM